MLLRLLSLPLIGAIRLYQKFISPLFPPMCRYQPTCSNYGLQALRCHGPFKGTFLTIWRILRCNPWGGFGYDPVPHCPQAGADPSSESTPPPKD